MTTTRNLTSIPSTWMISLTLEVQLVSHVGPIAKPTFYVPGASKYGTTILNSMV